MKIKKPILAKSKSEKSANEARDGISGELKKVKDEISGVAREAKQEFSEDMRSMRKEVSEGFREASAEMSGDLRKAKGELQKDLAEMKSEAAQAMAELRQVFGRKGDEQEHPENLLEIRKLTVKYRTDETLVHAVNDVSLVIGRGETLGILGETGAGKTTLALSVMRLLPERVGEVTDGQIIYDGHDLLSLSNARMRSIRGERISMVFQDPMASLNPLIPIGKQIAEALQLHNEEGRTKAEMDAVVDGILTRVGIPPERKREFPHQFSGGMKQRVVIAIALACSPELLIADEPTTALDVTIQAQVLARMQKLKTELGTSIILITHDLGVIARMCDRVAVMYAGEIIESGTIGDIFEGERRHPYTDGLFGSVPDLAVSARRLRPIDGLMPDPSNLPVGCKFEPRCPKRMALCAAQAPVDVVEGTHRIRCHVCAGEKADSIAGRGVEGEGGRAHE
jgi:peptide/nickel transport system ATP-binding protein